ncbi:WD40-repeat-containing domain protein [Trichoderma ceciliae]
MSSLTLQSRYYTLAWLCALPIELAAAAEMLDEEHDDLPLDDNDTNIYTLGRIGSHNIVLACLPAGQMGTNAAAAAAAQLTSTFPSIRFGLMVGIGGGVPSSEADIRLGDVVVSQPFMQHAGVVQYDFGKTGTHGKLTRTGFLNAPPRILLSALNKVRSNHLRGRSSFAQNLSLLNRLPQFSRDAAGHDVLFGPNSDHKGDGDCEVCQGVVVRPERPTQDVVIHYGTVASGNQVMKDGATRDKICSELGGVLCFEMEAAGLMNTFPCLVVRGICDYADAHKNKKWQPYAAATAAAFAKEIVSVIPSIAVDQESPVNQKVEQKLDLAKLPAAEGASFDSHVDEHNSRCLDNTRVGLRAQIAAWANDEDGKCIFWLNGMAGTGKSTIARTMAQTFADSRTLGGSFFFKKGELNRGNATKFFSTIVSQLIVRVPEMVPGIRNAIEEDPNIAEKTLKNQFEKLILQPLSNLKRAIASEARLVIVIDALDECERDEDIQTILRLLPQAKQIRPLSLRILVTSRPELPIRFGFKDMADGAYQDLILHQVPREIIESDISTFLKHELARIRAERSLPQEWPGEEKIHILIELAVPLFIFAATVCRFIGERNGSPRKRLDNILQFQTANQMPKLDRTYLPILNQVFENYESGLEEQAREFREIVGPIVILASPLSINSLSNILDIQREDISCMLDLLHSVLSVPNGEEPVKILHLSFRDFLLDHTKRDKSPFWVNELEMHEKMAQNCLRIMRELTEDMCNLTSPGILRSEIDQQIISRYLSAEIKYACRYWVYHLEQSQSTISGGDDSPIIRLLREKLLCWLEVMSHIGEVSESIRMIDRLPFLIKDGNARTLTFLRDAGRFARQNRSILENAPLQIYVSGVIFSRGAGAVCKAFSHSVPDWVVGWVKAEENNISSLQILEGHSKSVAKVVFSPDGLSIASASKDNTIRVWDVVTGEAGKTFETDEEGATCINFSPDGKHLATGSHGGKITVWDIPSGLVHSSKKLSGKVTAVTYLTNGKLMAVILDHDTLSLWDMAAESTYNSYKLSSAAMDATALSPNGIFIASTAANNKIKLWVTSNSAVWHLLDGHGDAINDLTFSSDSKRLASASQDRTIRVWDPNTGNLWAVLEGHGSGVTSAVFSCNGIQVASASLDGTVRLWDAETSIPRNILEGHLKRVNSVALSSRGKVLASASDDGTVRLWDAATPPIRSILSGHSFWVTDVAFSPDGKLVASASEDFTVRIWDAATGVNINILRGHSRGVTAIAFSPTGKILASASDDGTIRLWETISGGCLDTFVGHISLIRALAFSQDGEMIVSGSSDGTARIWKALTGNGKPHIILEGHSSWVRSVAFSPDCTLVASASDDRTVRIWDAQTGQVCSVFEGHAFWVTNVIFSPNGRQVASASEDHTVRLWELDTGSVYKCLKSDADTDNSATFSVDGEIIAFSPDGAIIACASHDCAIYLWDTDTGDLLCKLLGHSDRLTGVAFSPDGRLLASASVDRAIRLWDVDRMAQFSILEGHMDIVRAVAFSPDGKALASASNDNTVWLWDAAPDATSKSIEDEFTKITALNISDEGNLLISGSDDGALTLWNLTAEVVLGRFKDTSDAITAASLSPDNRLIASASSDNSIRLWDSTTGCLQSNLTGHTDRVNDLAFSPDGTLIASGSNDCTVRLWDIGQKESPVVLEATSIVKGVTFSPDATLLAIRCANHTVLLWDIPHNPDDIEMPGTNITAPKADSPIRETPSSSYLTFPNAIHVRCERFVRIAVVSPNGTLTASASDDALITVWDTATGKTNFKLRGHMDLISALTFSPDGAMLASGSNDSAVRIWDISSGAVVYCLEGHSGPVQSLAFSVDGGLLASSSSDTTIRLWDIASGLPHNVLRGHSNKVNTISFASTGQMLASGSDDCTVRLWDVPRGIPIRSYVGHDKPLSSVAFSQDDVTLVSASSDGVVKCWDIPKGVPKYHRGKVTCLAFSPKSDILASGSCDATVRLWNATAFTDPMVLEGHSDAISHLAFANERGILASESENGIINIWNLDKFPAAVEILCTIKKPSPSSRIYFSWGDTHLVSKSVDGSIRLWDAVTGNTAYTLENRVDVTSCNYIASEQLIVTGSIHGILEYQNIITEEVSSRFATGFPIGYLHYDIHDFVLFAWHYGVMSIVSLHKGPDDCHQGSYQQGLAPKKWRAAIGESSKAIDPFLKDADSDVLNIIAVNQRHDQIALVFGNVALLLKEDTQPLVLKGHSTAITTLAFSLNCKHFVTVSQDGKGIFGDTDSGETVLTLSEHPKDISGVSISHGGEYVAFTYSSGAMHIWNTTTGTLGTTIEPGCSLFTFFSLDNRLLGCAHADGSVSVWDIDTGKAQHTFHTSSARVKSAMFSNDSKQLLAFSDDDTALAGDLETGATHSYQCSKMPGDIPFAIASAVDSHAVQYQHPDGSAAPKTVLYHTSPISAISITEKGKLIASASCDGEVRIWRNIGASSQTMHAEKGITHMSLPPNGPISEKKDAKPTPNTLAFAVKDSTALDYVATGDWIYGKDAERLLWLPPDSRDFIFTKKNGYYIFGTALGQLITIKL